MTLEAFVESRGIRLPRLSTDDGQLGDYSGPEVLVLYRKRASTEE